MSAFVAWAKFNLRLKLGGYENRKRYQNKRKYYLEFYRLKDCYSWTKYVTKFIQLVSLYQVDQFSQTKLHWKVPNKNYLYMYGIYKINNRLLRY